MSELRTIDQQARLTPDKPALVMAHDGSAVTFDPLGTRCRCVDARIGHACDSTMRFWAHVQADQHRSHHPDQASEIAVSGGEALSRHL